MPLTCTRITQLPSPLKSSNTSLGSHHSSETLFRCAWSSPAGCIALYSASCSNTPCTCMCAWHPVPQVLKMLTIKRPVTVDRKEFYLQAEAFAALVKVDMVAIDGEAMAIAAVLACWCIYGPAVCMSQRGCTDGTTMPSGMPCRGQLWSRRQHRGRNWAVEPHINHLRVDHLLLYQLCSTHLPDSALASSSPMLTCTCAHALPVAASFEQSLQPFF